MEVQRLAVCQASEVLLAVSAFGAWRLERLSRGDEAFQAVMRKIVAWTRNATPS